MSSLLTSLADLERRYNELDHLMADPSNATDPTRLTVLAQSRWVDYPEFEKSVLHFKRNPELNHRLIPDARPGFRYGAGLEFQMTDDLVLRTGASREGWMMEPKSLSPLLYDITETSLSIGAGVRANPRWTFDFSLGTSLNEDRVVTADENPFFPGRYQLGNLAAGAMVTYHFGADDLPRSTEPRG